MNKLPTTFAARGQMDKMKQFIKNFATRSASEVSSTANVMQWIDGSFDIEAVPDTAINELRELAEVAEDKNKIALIDLFRLMILKENQAELILNNHWELIEVCVIGYLLAQDMQDTEARVMQNYHQMALKMLANVFSTAAGRIVIHDPEKAMALIQFCNQSMTSCNPKVTIHAALVLFNFLLVTENESKTIYKEELKTSVRTIDGILKVNNTEKDMIVTILLCMCRLLFKNHDITSWVEEEHR